MEWRDALALFFVAILAIIIGSWAWQAIQNSYYRQQTEDFRQQARSRYAVRTYDAPYVIHVDRYVWHTKCVELYVNGRRLVIPKVHVRCIVETPRRRY